MVFDHFPREDARVRKPSGETTGPYKMVFAGDTIFVLDAKSDVEKGDVILRRMPSGKEGAMTITSAQLFRAMGHMPDHFQVKFKEGRDSSRVETHTQTINIHSANAVQIGDNNTQEIVYSVKLLLKVIDDSDRPKGEKEEAKSLLQKFLSHPLVAAVVGATIGLGG